MSGLIKTLRTWCMSLCALALWPMAAQAQVANDWNASQASVYGSMVALDAANNAFVVGSDPLAGTVLVNKYSATGALLWQRVFDNPGTREQGTWITVDAGGNAWVVGSLFTASSGATNGIVVLKYDTNGNLLFQDVVASALGYGHRVVTDGAGNAYVLGRQWVPNASGNTTHDIATLKYAPNGVRQWVRYFGTNSTSVDSPAAIRLMPSGNILVGGSAGGTMLLVAYDPTGNQLWSKAVALSTGTTDVAVGPSGEFYAIGGTYSQATGNTAFVIKHDANFNELWRKTYANATYGVRAAVDSLGNAVVTGIVNPNGGYMNWSTFKLDPAGAVLWSRGLNLHLYNDEFPSAMVMGPDDAVYITGQGGPGPATGNVSYLRAVTTKYASDGSQLWIHGTFDTVRGLGLALGGDQSLVVVGQSPLNVMHFKQGPGGVSTLSQMAVGADVTSGPAPLTVNLQPVLLDYFGTSFQWDFGDGTGSTATNAQHTFAAGSYAVTLCGIGATGFIRASTPQTITATYVAPPPPVPTALTLASGSIVGGRGTQGTVTVSGNAGTLVTLASGNKALVKVPASVLIPAGATSTSFTITSARVRASTPVVITASANGTSVSATLTLKR